MSLSSNAGNIQSASDAIAAAMLAQWVQSQGTTDAKGDKKSAAVGATAGAGAGAATTAGMAQTIGALGDTAVAAADAAGVPASLVGAVMAGQPQGADILGIASSPDQKTGPMQLSQNQYKNDVLPGLSADDKKHIKQLTGKNAEQLNMNNPSDNVVAGTFMLKELMQKNAADPDKTLRAYARDVMGINPDSAQGLNGLNTMAAVMVALNELERKQALKPRPKLPSPAVDTPQQPVHQTQGGSSGNGAANNGGDQGSGGAKGGGGGDAGGSGGVKESGGPGHDIGNSGPVDLKNFKTAGDNVHFKNPQLEQHRDDILKAYHATGIPPEIIGAQMWHESRGNQNCSSRNSDGTADIGLMQIGQARANEYMKHFKLSGTLDVNNAADNIMAGALEIKYWLQQSGGDLRGALNGYVSGDVRGGNGIGDSNYANNCLRYMDLIGQGKPLPDNE